jgi:hypothetical protein
VAIDAQGEIHVMWRNSVAGARDMYASSSDDGGATFGKARKLGTGTWMLAACPMDGGTIVAVRDGLLTTVWRREGQVVLLGKDRRERVLGQGEQPWGAASGEGAFYAWIERRPGPLLLLAPDSERPQRVADGALDPVVAAAPDARGPVVILWETSRRGVATVLAQRAAIDE